MKIALLSDVHGNVPALEAVLEDVERWAPDEVIVNGDLINRGPESLACYELLQRSFPGFRGVQGNHEGFTVHCADRPEPAADDPRHGLKRFTYWTVAQMGEVLEAIRAWPDHLDLEDLEGASLHITHGSRLGNRAGILPETGGEELAAKLGDPRDLFVASHTHKPFVREVGETLVVNTGSIGASFDRDPRAAYGRLSFDGRRWRAEIVRLAYDRERAERRFHESGFFDGGGPLARIMLTEFHDSRGHMGPWMRDYQQAVLDGEIGLELAVRRYLQQNET